MQEQNDVLNPATGAIVDTVAVTTNDEVLEAIANGAQAFAKWSKTNAHERARLLMRWSQLIIEARDELARILTLENGKPLAESLGEIDYANAYIVWYAEEAKRIYGRTIPTDSDARRIVVTRQGIGLVAAITPWNFPAAMLARKAAPALAAGCTFITKPAEETPLSTMHLIALAHRAGIPTDVIQYVNGKGTRIGALFTDSPHIRKISFTGSTAVGKLLMRNSAETIKHTTMELGGQAPFIVCQDADIDLVVRETLAAKFRNAGQACVAANRFIVHEDVAQEFGTKLTEKVIALKVGNGLDDGVTIGPLINKAGFTKVQNHIDDAKQKGAIVLTGDRYLYDDDKGFYFVYPTVLTGVTETMQVMTEETFGPVVPIITFRTLEEAIRLANATPFGLAGYFFTKDYTTGIILSEALDFGIIGWNAGGISAAHAPFGGMKESGIGREGGIEGIEPYLETKYIAIQLNQ